MNTTTKKLLIEIEYEEAVDAFVILNKIRNEILRGSLSNDGEDEYTRWGYRVTEEERTFSHEN